MMFGAIVPVEAVRDIQGWPKGVWSEALGLCCRCDARLVTRMKSER